MNGTRTARIAALAAALLLGVALVVTTVLSAAPHDGHHGAGSTASTDRHPVLLRSADRSAQAAPRTTPPPSLVAPAPSGRPAQAETVEHR